MRVECIPIRTTTQIGPGGTRSRTLSVYCPFRGQSFSADHCRRCAKLVTWSEDPEAPDASIVCASDDAPEAERAIAVHVGDRLSGRFDDIASRTPVGVVMDRSTLAVHTDLELAALKTELGAATGRVVPVVDDDGRLLGVLALDRASTPPPPAPGQLRNLLSTVAPPRVLEVMTAHVVAFPETARIRDALNAMIVERVRYLPIVSEGGRLVGVVWDVDLLSWLVRAERGEPRGEGR